MNFTSLPSYLDTQHWHQQPNHHQLGNTTTPNTTTNTNENHQQLPPPPPGQPQSSIRPNSMTDRARLAKIPQPESALKCPRCDSTNTKFCYFNNYSLSQPRHFCKTCRRYWTRGGALRNVPVGGGCRRNKRSKGSRSKSPVSGTQKGGGGGPSTSTTSSTNTASSLPSNSFSSDHMMANMTPSLLPQLPFMNSLHHLHDYGDHMGLSFSAIQAPLGQGSIGGASDMDFQLGSSTTTNATAVGGGGGGNMLSDQWRSLQQFPFLGGGTYSFDGDIAAAAYSKPSGSVKMEENQGLNLSRQFLGIHGNDQYWGGGSGAGGGGAGGGGGNGGVGNAWTDLSGFTSSTTSHQLL